jgi:hypothetical protein
MMQMQTPPPEQSDLSVTPSAKTRVAQAAVCAAERRVVSWRRLPTLLAKLTPERLAYWQGLLSLPAVRK